jgi:hypothetical protein
MANNNAARLLSTGLLAALSASLCVGQEPAASAPGASAAEPPKVMSMAPPNPPKVTCKGDQLTVTADNSTLSSVLTAIRACTGVLIDIPEGASATRSFDQLGPGPARQVLASLLNGTDFNYVIESSVADPEKVEAVLLIPRASDKDKSAATLADKGAAPTAARRAWALTQKNGRAVYNGSNVSDDASSADGASDAPAQDETPASPVDNSAANAATPAALTSPAADAAAPPVQPVADASASTSANQAPDKVTEDKITNMQQLFEQRRQMIESQTAPAKPQP